MSWVSQVRLFNGNQLCVYMKYSNCQFRFSFLGRTISSREITSFYLSVFLFCPTDELITYVLISLLPFACVSEFRRLLIETLQHSVTAAQTRAPVVTFRVWGVLMKLCLNDGWEARCRKQAFPVSVIRRK